MIISKNELSSVRAEFEGASIALRFGCYDVVHPGHQLGIDYAAAQADVLVVGVMPDEYVRKEKGLNRPINPAENRVETIDRADGVNVSFIAPPSVLGMAGVFMSLRPNVYVEEDEYGESKLKTAFLSALGINYKIDRDSRIGSSSAMIAQLGIAGAVAQSQMALRMSNTAA